MDTLADQPPSESASIDEGRDFGWNVMLSVLAMAALECFLAMRFGHHAKLKRQA
jgi:hypothetical protein